MFEEPEGATPIDAAEAADLLPQHIQTRDQLNTWEQENILFASLKMKSGRLGNHFPLSEASLPMPQRLVSSLEMACRVSSTNFPVPLSRCLVLLRV